MFYQSLVAVPSCLVGVPHMLDAVLDARPLVVFTLAVLFVQRNDTVSSSHTRHKDVLDVQVQAKGLHELGNFFDDLLCFRP